jgi:hypothetical protein
MLIFNVGNSAYNIFNVDCFDQETNWKDGFFFNIIFYTCFIKWSYNTIFYLCKTQSNELHSATVKLVKA